MLLFAQLLACSGPDASAPGTRSDTGTGEVLFDIDEDPACTPVLATEADIPADWGQPEIEGIVAVLPTMADWEFAVPSTAEATDAIELRAEVIGSEWISRGGTGVSCRPGVELAVDITWAWDIGDGGATGSGEGRIYASSPDADHVYLDWVEFDSAISEEWQDAAEAEFGASTTFDSGYLGIGGTWMHSDVDVGGWFTDPSSSATLRRGPWAFE